MVNYVFAGIRRNIALRMFSNGRWTSKPEVCQGQDQPKLDVRNGDFSSDLEVSGCKSSDFNKDIRYFSYNIIENSSVFEGQFHVYGAFFILKTKKHECIKRFAYF